MSKSDSQEGLGGFLEGPGGASKVKKGLGVFWRVFEGPDDMGGSRRVQ